MRTGFGDAGFPRLLVLFFFLFAVEALARHVQSGNSLGASSVDYHRLHGSILFLSGVYGGRGVQVPSKQLPFLRSEGSPAATPDFVRHNREPSFLSHVRRTLLPRSLPSFLVFCRAARGGSVFPSA